MTEPMAEVHPDVGDARRAASLLRHYTQPDLPGVSAVLSETSETGRWVELSLSLCQLITVVTPELRTSEGRSELQAVIHSLASIELDPPTRPARRW